MKTYRITLTEKNGTGKTYCIYTEAGSEAEAAAYFNNNFSRFNNLVRIKEV
jgi:hypothetical protein